MSGNQGSDSRVNQVNMSVNMSGNQGSDNGCYYRLRYFNAILTLSDESVISAGTFLAASLACAAL